MKYSIQYKNAGGLTGRTEFLPFETDAAAEAYGREGSLGDAIVEVWQGDHLVVRLLADEQPRPI